MKNRILPFHRRGATASASMPSHPNGQEPPLVLLADFNREESRQALQEHVSAAGAFEYIPLELDDETARELCADLTLRTLGDQEPEGHG